MQKLIEQFTLLSQTYEKIDLTSIENDTNTYNEG